MPAMTRPDPQQLARRLTRRDRHGWSWVELSVRSVLCGSMARCAELLEPIAEQLRKEMLALPVVHTDDTPMPLAMPQSSQGGSRERGCPFRRYLVAIGSELHSLPQDSSNPRQRFSGL